MEENNVYYDNGWYINSDYYITGKTNGIKYIAKLLKLEKPRPEEEEGGRVKVFNNIRDANNGNTVVTKGKGLTNGTFRYNYLSNNDWELSGPLDTKAQGHSMGANIILTRGGSKRRRRTRKSRKVKRRRTGKVKRRY